MLRTQRRKGSDVKAHVKCVGHLVGKAGGGLLKPHNLLFEILVRGCGEGRAIDGICALDFRWRTIVSNTAPGKTLRASGYICVTSGDTFCRAEHCTLEQSRLEGCGQSRGSRLRLAVLSPFSGHRSVSAPVLAQSCQAVLWGEAPFAVFHPTASVEDTRPFLSDPPS